VGVLTDAERNEAERGRRRRDKRRDGGVRDLPDGDAEGGGVGVRALLLQGLFKRMRGAGIGDVSGVPEAAAPRPRPPEAPPRRVPLALPRLANGRRRRQTPRRRRLGRHQAPHRRPELRSPLLRRRRPHLLTASIISSSSLSRRRCTRQSSYCRSRELV